VMKYYKLIIKNFDQVKKHNFDQVNFGQVIISLYKEVFQKLRKIYFLFADGRRRA
jgi:hypothetical protein